METDEEKYLRLAKTAWDDLSEKEKKENYLAHEGEANRDEVKQNYIENYALKLKKQYEDRMKEWGSND